MKSNRLLTKIFVSLFIIVISTPLILFALRIKIEPKISTDRKISLNFKRNFPLREDLIKLDNRIKSDLLHTNAFPNKVVEGLDGWKFIGDKFSNALSESKGFLVFTETELLTIKEKLTKKRDYLKELGIDYYIAVAPNKLSVYGNKLPISKYGDLTKMKQFESICKSLNINYINLGNKFPNPDSEKLYYKTDTHWNFTAGIYAFNEVYDNLNKTYTNHNLRNYNLKDLVKSESNALIGDLNDMLFIDRDEKIIRYEIKEPIEVSDIKNHLEIPNNYVFNPTQYESRYKTDTNNLKIMILNDSFFGYLKSFFVENFGESVLLWDHTFRKKLIKAEKPDIFFQEIVERNLDVFLEDLQ